MALLGWLFLRQIAVPDTRINLPLQRHHLLLETKHLMSPESLRLSGNGLYSHPQVDRHFLDKGNRLQ